MSLFAGCVWLFRLAGFMNSRDVGLRELFPPRARKRKWWIGEQQTEKGVGKCTEKCIEKAEQESQSVEEARTEMKE